MAKENKIPLVLTIAGSDSGSGAGIQADARTIHALGGYALTAITAVTAQNTSGVAAWRAVPPVLIAAQIKAVLEDFSVAAVKTGLLPGATAVRAIGRELARHPRLLLVVDPVIGSTSGAKFLPPAGLRVLKKALLPRATLVTPNWPEVAALTGMKVQTHEDAEAAARQLAKECGCAVLVKGGHAPGSVCRDCLVTAAGHVRWFESPRVKTHNTHGTGCVLSAAIATNLAKGEKLESAVAQAHEFLWRSLRAGRKTRWGRGHGPAFAG
ncbi:MAG TPA: bifunctional hydroxymethylpyrimidine kinase/phosphomethylpyrimidine kinase [Opitutaceae bacterium]|nr:bifunctional hydroxymethylpyrimidine kinase/phosphomethylpyrimidine kinase [Opitutaceae bacterium]